MRAANPMEQQGNLFALLGNFGDDDATKIMNRVTPNRSTPSDKKKPQGPQQQKNKKKQQYLKLAPEMLRAKPLVLPDHVLKRELVIRNSKKNDRVHASQDVVAAQKTQEMAKVEDKNLTLKEYEKVQAEKKKKKNSTDVQSLEGKEEYTTVKKATKKVITDLFSNIQTAQGRRHVMRSESARAVLGSQEMVGAEPVLNYDDASQFPVLRGISKA